MPKYEFWFDRFTRVGEYEVNQEINHIDENGEIVTPKIVSLYGHGSQQLWLPPGRYRVTNYVIGTNSTSSYDFIIEDDGTYRLVDNAPRE